MTESYATIIRFESLTADLPEQDAIANAIEELHDAIRSADLDYLACELHADEIDALDPEIDDADLDLTLASAITDAQLMSYARAMIASFSPDPDDEIREMMR